MGKSETDDLVISFGKHNITAIGNSELSRANNYDEVRF